MQTILRQHQRRQDAAEAAWQREMDRHVAKQYRLLIGKFVTLKRVDAASGEILPDTCFLEVSANINVYHSAMKNPHRTTLLINCSVEEAKQIRAAARKEERTISAFVLRSVRTRLKIQKQVEETERNFYINQFKRAGGTMRLIRIVGRN